VDDVYQFWLGALAIAYVLWYVLSEIIKNLGPPPDGTA
jgi:hypothetical protein